MVTISVVMPVYNTNVPMLRRAVESILNQTFQDFELLIIDDGSTNDCAAYLDALNDPRVRILRNETNLGITKSLNIGFRAAQGKYIARMDSDDVSLPDRFEKQFAFMEQHPDVIVCGSKTGKNGKEPPVFPQAMESMEEYRVKMLFRNPGPVHPTAFFRREKLVQHKIEYNEQLIYAQDYDMWMRIIQYGNVCVLPEALLYRIMHSDQISNKHREQQIRCDKITQKKLLEQLLDHVTEEEVDLHYFHSTGYYPEVTMTPRVNQWYRRLLAANRRKKIYNQSILEKQVKSIKKALVYHTVKPNASRLQRNLVYLRYMPIETIKKKFRK